MFISEVIKLNVDPKNMLELNTSTMKKQTK